LQEVTVSGEVADEITPPTGVDCDDRSRQYVPTVIASGSVRFWPPEVTTSACGPATSVVSTVSVAVIEVAEFTTTLLTVRIPLGTVTVSPLWKLVLAPVMLTVIWLPTVAATAVGDRARAPQRHHSTGEHCPIF